ncbi:MAG: IclR family transcriptional regulator [Paracoccaceae bacterium]
MGTVAKALSLLDFFNRARPAIGLSDMARLSGMNKATVHRLLTELQAQGFVEQTGSGREYRLGPAFLRLAALREAAVPMRDLAAGVLADLSAATHETAHVSLLQGDTLITVAFAYSAHHGTRVAMDDAEVLTFHNTSSGLAVLAFAPAEFTDRALARPLEKRTDKTETDPARIRAALTDIRRSGMAQNEGGFEADVHSHAVPLFDARARVIGAIAVAAPTARMTPDHQTLIQHELRHHALRLTRLMGGFLPDGFLVGAAA